jgi:hypothetical protein
VSRFAQGARLALPAAVLTVLGGVVGLPDAARPAVTLNPPVRKLHLRVGRTQRFSVAGERILCFWRIDGRTISGALPEWSFTPTTSHIGRHTLTVDIHEPTAITHRAWALRVEPAHPPRVVATTPEASALQVDDGEAVELSLRTEPAGEGESVHTAWTVDGAPAGEGDTLRIVPPHPGTVRARALATGSLGSAVAREWEIDVRPTQMAAAPPTTVPPPEPATTTVTTPLPTTVTEPPPPTTTITTPPRPTTSSTLAVRTPATTTSTEPARATTTTPRAVPTTTTEPPEEDVASATPSPRPASSAQDGITTQDIRLLLQHYVSAWNHHDVDELRRLGQVSTEQQADALRAYFDRVADLEVEVVLLDLTSVGDRHTVRFTRRDRFRDPTGRVVSKETPPIEKQVVRGAGGLRFVNPLP